MRGKGGFVCVEWLEVLKLILVFLFYIVMKYGFDWNVGFFLILVMFMISYVLGFWFMLLIGGFMFSFYDWYVDFFLVFL